MITITIKPGNYPQVKTEFKPFAVRNSLAGEAALEAEELIKRKLGLIPEGEDVPNEVPAQDPQPEANNSSEKTDSGKTDEGSTEKVTATNDDEVEDVSSTAASSPAASSEKSTGLPPA